MSADLLRSRADRDLVAIRRRMAEVGAHPPGEILRILTIAEREPVDIQLGDLFSPRGDDRPDLRIVEDES